jgi:pimeloyl-ACP methyl ester carboxylesterase
MVSKKVPLPAILSPVILLLALAAPAPGAGSPRVPLPLDLVDVLDGAKFKIRVPQNWNGTLLVYLQGTKTVPVPEPAVVPPVAPGSQPALEATLLSRGYALAASDFGNVDMQVKEAAQDSLALTSYFRGRVGDPARVILWGTSNGSLAALKMIEDYPLSFDGAIATCAPAAGFSRGMDRHLDFGLAYAAAFGWPDEEWGPLEDLRAGLNVQPDVLTIAQLPKPDGSNRGAWEFIRLVQGISSEAFWGTNPVYNYQGWMLNLIFATWARATNESFAAGPFAQNLDHRYTLKPEEKTYLAGLGVHADELLAKMNARRNIAAAPWARDYVVRYGDLRGLLRRPAMTLHTTMDNVADASHESAYRVAVKGWGAEANLYQAYVNAAGHCVFTPNQLLTTVAAMERWLDSGKRPDASWFPEAEGFANSFAPPPWPY